MFKVIIAGGRDFDNYNILENYCKKVLKEKKEVEVVSGTAKGADKLGEKFAIDNNMGLKSFPAPWDDINGKPKSSIGTRPDGKEYWKGAGSSRNGTMAVYADALIAFWDDKSKGTKDMIDRMKAMKKPVKIYHYGLQTEDPG